LTIYGKNNKDRIMLHIAQKKLGFQILYYKGSQKKSGKFILPY